MAIDQQITCDICGIDKGETNHWLIAAIASIHHDPEETLIAFAPIAAARPNDGADGEIKHICGHNCALKLLSQWLESLTTPTTERQQS